MSEIRAEEVIRRYYAAYERKDKRMLESLLDEDFKFSSPNDDQIDKQLYFAKCWPFSEQVRAFHIEKLSPHGEEIFVQYECQPATAATFRNIELFRIEQGKVREIAVYFGRKTRGKSD